MRINDVVSVSAAEFLRNIGTYQDMALITPVAVTENGRERTVLLSAEEFHRLKRRDRKVLGLSDVTPEHVAAIAASEMDARHYHLNDELKDWQL